MQGGNSRWYDYKYHLNRYQLDGRPPPPEPYNFQRQCVQVPAHSTPLPYSRSQPRPYDGPCCACPIHGNGPYNREPLGPTRSAKERPRGNEPPPWSRPTPEDAYWPATCYRPPDVLNRAFHPQISGNSNNYRYNPEYDPEAYQNKNDCYRPGSLGQDNFGQGNANASIIKSFQ